MNPSALIGAFSLILFIAFSSMAGLLALCHRSDGIVMARKAKRWFFFHLCISSVFGSVSLYCVWQFAIKN